MLQFNFKKTHIADSVITEADFRSTLEFKVMVKIRLKIRQDIQTTPIEMTTTSSDVADEEQFFFTQVDNNDESEQQAKQWVGLEEPTSLKTSVKEFTMIDGITTLFSTNGIKANAQIGLEQTLISC